MSPSHVLFLTDNVLEVHAAQEAGMLSHAVVRPGNAALSQDNQDRLSAVSSFYDIDIPQRQPNEETIVPANPDHESETADETK